jgi:hypothetical protein
MPVCTDPGAIALKLVETAQLEPIDVSAVAAHATGTGKGVSCTVAGAGVNGVLGV